MSKFLQETAHPSTMIAEATLQVRGMDGPHGEPTEFVTFDEDKNILGVCRTSGTNVLQNYLGQKILCAVIANREYGCSCFGEHRALTDVTHYLSDIG